MNEVIIRQIPETFANLRCDQALTELFPEYSRSRIQQWLKDGSILIENQVMRPKDKIMGNEMVSLQLTETPFTQDLAQDIPLNIIYEDQDILIINKPAGLTVHPGAGQPDNTLLNALLYYDKSLAEVPRAGIIHRLDKDTSGILVIARNITAQINLAEQLQQRSITRTYWAIVQGHIIAGATIDAPIGRHKTDRLKQAVVQDGKPAITHYRVLQKFPHHTLVQVNLETGRTHQIRVHMAYIHHFIIGDPLYGSALRGKFSATLREYLQAFPRQALHAKEITLQHPKTQKIMSWQTPLAQDMQSLLDKLEEYK